MQQLTHGMLECWFFIRGLITLIWLCLSTGIGSPLCILFSLFSRKLAYALGKLWCRLLLAIAGARIEIRGLDKIKSHQRYTVLSNHQSQLDILTLISAIPLYLYFISKKELFGIPFFGWGLRALGHIPIDRRNTRKALNVFTQAAKQVRSQDHMSLVLFPEGTRSPDGSLGEFKQGSFTLVLEAGLPVIPTAICGSREILPKGSLMARPGTITITFGDPIDISNYHQTEKNKLSAGVRDAIQRIQLKHQKITQNK